MRKKFKLSGRPYVVKIESEGVTWFECPCSVKCRGWEAYCKHMAVCDWWIKKV